MDEAYQHYKNGDYETAFKIWSSIHDDCFAPWYISIMFRKNQLEELADHDETKYALKAADCFDRDSSLGTWYTKPFFSAGVAYLNGRGVNRDLKQAIYWFKLSSRSGRSDASLNLGSIYINEYNDIPKAWAYYTLAAEQGGAATDEGEDVVDYADSMFERLNDQDAKKAKTFYRMQLNDYRRKCENFGSGSQNRNC